MPRMTIDRASRSAKGPAETVPVRWNLTSDLMA